VIYRELLVMRKALLWYFGIVIGLSILALIMMATASHRGTDNTDLQGISVPCAWMALIFAAIFGVALGNASREPARVLWVLPADRLRSALEVVGVDLVASAVAYAGTIAVSYVFFIADGLVRPVIHRGSIDWGLALEGLCLVWAVYGWSAVTGVLLRRIAYAGIVSFPFLLLWMMFGSMEGRFGELLRFPIATNPLAVFSNGFAVEAIATHQFVPTHREMGEIVASLMWMGTTWETPLLLATAVAGCAIAVLVWRRAEVLSV